MTGCKKMFRWLKVVFNLPNMKSYDFSSPWVYRVREDGNLAMDICWYIDDGRPTAATAWYG